MFSLACVVFEAATGTKLFDPVAAYAAVRAAHSPPNPNPKPTGGSSTDVLGRAGGWPRAGQLQHHQRHQRGGGEQSGGGSDSTSHDGWDSDDARDELHLAMMARTLGPMPSKVGVLSPVYLLRACALAVFDHQCGSGSNCQQSTLTLSVMMMVGDQ
jgi:hypothetical protein